MVTTLPSAGTGGEADSSDASSLELEELEEALPPSPVATHFLRQKEAPKNAAKPFLDPSQMFHARGDVSLFFWRFFLGCGWVSLLNFETHLSKNEPNMLSSIPQQPPPENQPKHTTYNIMKNTPATLPPPNFHPSTIHKPGIHTCPGLWELQTALQLHHRHTHLIHQFLATKSKDSWKSPMTHPSCDDCGSRFTY